MSIKIIFKEKTFPYANNTQVKPAPTVYSLLKGFNNS